MPSGPPWENVQTPVLTHGRSYVTGLPNRRTSRSTLTQHADPVPVGSIGPAHRGDGDSVMTEVHKDVNVLPVVERVGVLHLRALNEPGRYGTESGPRRQNQDTDSGWERAALGEVSRFSSGHWLCLKACWVRPCVGGVRAGTT